MGQDSSYEDNIISEGAEYSPKSEFSKPRVVEESVKKCIDARSKEMIAGYYNYKFDKNGVPLKVWIPDQREVFNSTVEALKNLLSPEIKLNKEFKEVKEGIEEEKKNLFNKYCYESMIPEYDDHGKIVYKKTGDKYIPMKGEQVLIKQLRKDGAIVVKEIVGGWDRKIDFYLSEIVILNDKLFAAMNELIDSLNYFKQKVRF